MFRTMVILALCGSAATAAGPGPFEAETTDTPETAIDRAVFANLQAAGLRPARPCSDGAFLRRVYLDVIGTLPTAQEAREFLADKSAGKRAALIDRLLARPEFVDYWTMKWCDALRVKAEFPINLWPNAVQAYHRWVRTAVRENRPYDRFVRELLTASGSNFRDPAVNFCRAYQGREAASLAQAAALTFMGTRADKWPKGRLAAAAAFFSKVGYKATNEWKEEIVFFDPAKGGPAFPVAAFPDGTPVTLSADRDPRAVFADWLVDAKNPWFAKAAANRAWFWLVGRGIVHEADDFRPDNPPSNPELLALLEKELVASGWDLKSLYRRILNSRTYQLSCIPQSPAPGSAARFGHYALRRMEAEVLIDALCQLTGTTEKYTSAIPEPYTFIPEEQRAISLADGSITSTFLELFGRSSRDSGLLAERPARATAAQRLDLLNASHIQRKLQQGGKLLPLGQLRTNPREAVGALYLAVLSRYPTDEEFKTVMNHLVPGGRGSPRPDAAQDVLWALINSDEFIYKH